ncbi:MAG: hypothetical protein JSW58_15660 [Candidatus Latescibacterota bacterium]|nr:MAG: hypothetical protein JSW58_15660 [Candidatus Latescibacterota bacterium]
MKTQTAFVVCLLGIVCLCFAACQTDDVTGTGDKATHGDPQFVPGSGTATLVPNGDAGPNQWSPEPASAPNHYSLVDEIWPADNQWVYTYDRDIQETYYFSNMSGTDDIVVDEIRFYVDAAITPNSATHTQLVLKYYINSAMEGILLHQLDATTPNEIDVFWTYTFSDLNWDRDEINTLACRFYMSGDFADQWMKVHGVFAEVDWYETGGHGKGPNPHQDP